MTHCFLFVLLQHDLDTLSTLADLRSHTTVVELKAGESLFHHSDGTYNDQRERDGLYFIEHGMMVSAWLNGLEHFTALWKII